MIKIFDGAQIDTNPTLRDQMFRHRRVQFIDRLKWDLPADGLGREIDQYDPLGPLYVISVDDEEHHRGSLRLLPTTGRTMTMEHFPALAPSDFREPGRLECTRFCIAPGAPATVSAELFLAVLEIGLARGLHGSYGVFDARMMRIYSRLGTPTRLVSKLGEGAGALCLGYFDFDPALRDGLSARAGIEVTPMLAAA